MQGLPSSVQVPPSAWSTWLHPPFAHTSSVHGLPSSAQGPSLGLCVQPPLGSQPSLVQGLASSQPCGLPRHLPSAQVSPKVQAFWSLQTFPLVGKCAHKLSPPHVSLVQGLPSSQSPSSVRPLQSSSTPLQVSTLAVGASQRGTPPTQAFSTPLHTPTAFFFSHGAVISKSSVLPLQSSSMPLQLSLAGTGAWQSLSPAEVQVRIPLQTPYKFLFSHAVLSPLLVALTLHVHTPLAGAHCLTALPLSASM